MSKIDYAIKHPEASKDYKTAYDIVSTLKIYGSTVVTPDNIKVFRKYIYDLAAKQNKEFSTTKKGGFGLRVTRMKAD